MNSSVKMKSSLKSKFKCRRLNLLIKIKMKQSWFKKQRSSLKREITKSSANSRKKQRL